MDAGQFAFLKALLEATGPSGYEWEAQQIWRERVRSLADHVETDALGNCIATLNPDGEPRIMLEAHIDTIGFQVRDVDDRGFLSFAPIGSFDPSTLPGTRVRIKGRNEPVLGTVGRVPIHVLEDDRKAPELKQMWIDIGARDKEEALSLVAVGDPGSWIHGLERLHGNILTSSGMDDRVGAYVLAEVFRSLAATRVSACVLAVSSVQEEVGLRGAVVSSYRADAPYGVAIEVNWTTDHPEVEARELGDLRVGAGPILNRGANTHPRMYERLAAAANAEGIAYQIKPDPIGTANDENVMQLSRTGMATGLIKVPTRYLHTTSEIISSDDVDQCVTVLRRFVQDFTGPIDVTR